MSSFTLVRTSTRGFSKSVLGNSMILAGALLWFCGIIAPAVTVSGALSLLSILCSLFYLFFFFRKR